MPYPRLAPEDDRPLPLVPPKYADGIRRQCDGSTVLTFGRAMLDGETRVALVLVSGFERGGASVRLVKDLGRPEGRRRRGDPRRNDGKRLPAAELRRLERRAEQSANREESFTRRRYCRALAPRQVSDTVR